MQKFVFLAPRQGKLLQFKSVTTKKKHFVQDKQNAAIKNKWYKKRLRNYLYIRS